MKLHIYIKETSKIKTASSKSVKNASKIRGKGFCVKFSLRFCNPSDNSLCRNYSSFPC